MAKNDFALIQLLAGNSYRFNNKKKKQFIFKNNLPLFLISVYEFLKIESLKEIIFVINKSDINIVKHYLEEYFFKFNNSLFNKKSCILYQNIHLIKKKKLNIKIIIGGSERFFSVKNSVNLVTSEYVFIHDSARPKIKSYDIKKIQDLLKTNNAILPVEKVTDTIKSVCGNFVLKNIDRENLVAASTPQSFKSKNIIKSYNNFNSKKRIPTDDVEVYMDMYKKVKIYYLKYPNNKITRVEDIKNYFN